MVVPPAGGPGPASGSTTTFRISPASSSAAATVQQVHRSKMGLGAASGSNGASTTNGNGIPLSARKAQPLNLATVERRGYPTAAREVPKSARPFGLSEAPTYRPTEEEWKDPLAYMAKIYPEGRNYGIIKLIPPDSWEPPLAIDTERFHFRTRRQELNSVEGGTRANLNYLDQLSKFHRQQGTNLNRFPSVDKRPLDLYKLKKAVECRGGFDRVCKGKKWAEIGRDLGYSGKIMSSLSTSLKNSYFKWLHPYEEYLRQAKPSVQRQLEYENGGPYTPSPSPMKRAYQQSTPTKGFPDDSAAVRASTALQSTMQDDHVATSATDMPRSTISSGFTAVNAGGGFTAVNAQGPPPTAVNSFPAINSPANGDTGHSTPGRSVNSPKTSAKNTPDLRPSAFGSSTPLSNGQPLVHLKRQLSTEAESSCTNEEVDSAGRRSKRLKREAAPTITGSYMTQPRFQTPRFFTPRDRSKDKPGERCEACGMDDHPTTILLCDGCDVGYHIHCLTPPLRTTPDYDWYCSKCLVGTGEFGFEEGGVYSLRQFQEKAQKFKENHFANKLHFDPILNVTKPITEDDVEREFWRLVENLQENVEVEYGADIHSTTHGSGFPTMEKNPRDPHATDPWNLNRLPLVPDSLFRFIKTNISGMTVPWLYVGMVFSTFCWHAEDHYTYSANYQHFGATKTWYGIPADDAEKFEDAMRQAVPELFETQPDLLFQLVTLLTPEQLRKAGVRVYAVDQRAGQMVITFPQAYHAGFNHGFNFNEAVNFAPSDWEPYGEAGALRLQDFRRQPCFSHDELLLNAASQKDITIKTAKWLGPALQRLLDRELRLRENFLAKHQSMREHKSCTISGTEVERKSYDEPCYVQLEVNEEELQEDTYSCAYCKAYAYLSRYYCRKSKKVMCLIHAGAYECCDQSEPLRFLGYPTQRNEDRHELIYRISNETLRITVERIVERARTPEIWAEKLDKLLEDEPKPSLKTLRSLLSEGEKIQWDLPQLVDLRKFVERCNEWVEEATGYITRRQQNRGKNGRAWRKGSSTKAAEAEERDREYRKMENITRLIEAADKISFNCPEITTLRERADNIAEFQRKAATALTQQLSHRGAHTLTELDELVELGRGYNVDIPEVEQLDKLVQQLKWHDEAAQRRAAPQNMQQVVEFLTQGRELGIPETDSYMTFFEEERRQGEMWNAKAQELIAVENVHYQQLDALSKQASTIPVTPDTLAKIDAILKKQRDAQEQIMALYDKSKEVDLRQRPKYKDVREAMEALEELNSKPQGTLDLEKEQKRHEDWMRKGKKLFGKANAPLHILHAHMKQVEEKNRACFDTSDQPRMPVEPASRANTPEENENLDGSSSVRDVFCICRRPEAGMMIECELCHEWYHGKCLKIARGKVKEDDKYTCPICDHRVRIPRDAARPKLEDLQAWQDEIPTLPFQPEEEDTLDAIISHGANFRHWVSQYINPTMSTPEELTTQRFYLRKLEGADILLADEINFFRQELHKWVPVAPDPPPMIEVSLSTRKPRPTKQQKLMAQLGISNPDDLPAQFRTKSTQYRQRKQSEGSISRPPNLQPAPDQSTTPPGLPPSLENPNNSGYFDSSANPPTSSFQNSPIFASVQPNFVNPSTASPPPFSVPSSAINALPIDPAMFDQERSSPLPVNFGSSSCSGGLDNIFNEMTNVQESDQGALQFGSEMDTVERENDVDQFLASSGD